MQEKGFEPKPMAREPYRVLVVDDDQAVLDDYRRAFEGLTARPAPTPPAAPTDDIVYCRQGVEALQAVKRAAEAKAPYSVIFLDAYMPPGMDGFTTAERIRENDPHVELVVVSAATETLPPLQGLQLGPEHKLFFLTKPFRADVVRRLAATLGAKSSIERKLLQNQRVLRRQVQGLRADLAATTAQLMTEKTNISEAQAALKDSDELYQNLTQVTDDGVVIHYSWRIVDVNRAVEQQFGYRAAELIGRSFFDLFPVESRDDIRRRLAGVYVPPFLSQGLRKDGSVIIVELSAKTFYYKQKSMWLTVINDVSEKKRAEKERAVLQAQLEQSQKMEAIGRLAGGIAHDFNNLLTVLIGYSEMLFGTLAPDDPRRHDVLEIRQTAKRAAELTEQLLAFSRRQIIIPKVTDLNELIAETQKMLARLIGETIEFVFAPADRLWLARVDHGQFGQVLMNLVVNARDSMPQGGKLTVRTANVVLDPAYCATHPGARTGDYVMIEIADTGEGMSEPVIKRLFEPFFTTKRDGKGTGLGLAIVYGIVKQNNGYIEVQSAVGKGTTFRIYLPRVEGRPEPVVTKPAAPLEAAGGETILVVEDEEIIRKMIVKVLETHGYRVLDAADGVEALALARRQPDEIHLLVTDVVMPQMDGVELAATLGKQRPGLRVLFSSGYSEGIMGHGGVLDGDTHFIQKPFTIEELLDHVRKALEA
jgi:PAS domain S-box-containing protein